MHARRNTALVALTPLLVCSVLPAGISSKEPDFKLYLTDPPLGQPHLAARNCSWAGFPAFRRGRRIAGLRTCLHFFGFSPLGRVLFHRGTAGNWEY